MPDLIRFVDSISATPTTRLDLNDESSWWVKSFTAAPPRLRRSTASNAMRDGITVGSASYDSRTLTIELECRKSTQDAGATEIQKLWRELDRANNWIQYQPQGASKPVFFRTYRSDTSGLADIAAQAAMRTITIEVLAEPFALGLKESLGPYTISSNPAAASNPGYVDLPSILGDVAAPLVYWDSASGGSAYMSRLVVAHAGGSEVASVITALQAESLQVGIDTTNPGGGPDAAMSGTGTNNYLRTSFATTSILNSTRVQTLTAVAQPAGLYRILAAVRRSGTTSTLQVRAVVGNASVASTGTIGSTITLPATTNRQLVDLGVFAWPDATPVGVTGLAGTSQAKIDFHAGRTGGSDTLDWDAFLLVPAGGQQGTITTLLTSAAATSPAGNRLVLDGANDQMFMTTSSSDPTTTAVPHVVASASGAAPSATPGLSNRLYVQSFDGTTPAAGVTTTTAVSLAYWPRYLLVRPVST